MEPVYGSREVREGACRSRRQEFFAAPIRYKADELAIETDDPTALKLLSSADADLAHANERVITNYLVEFGTVRSACRFERG